MKSITIIAVIAASVTLMTAGAAMADEDDINALKATIEQLLHEKSVLLSHIDLISEDVNTLTKENRALEDKIDEFADYNKTMAKQIDNNARLEAKVDKFKNTIKELKKEKRELQDRITAVRDKKVEWKEAVSTNSRELDALNAEIAALNLQISEKDAENSERYDKYMKLYSEFVKRNATAPFEYLGRDMNGNHLIHVTFTKYSNSIPQEFEFAHRFATLGSTEKLFTSTEVDRTIYTGETVRWKYKSAHNGANVEIKDDNGTLILDWTRNGPSTDRYTFNTAGTFTWSGIDPYNGHAHWNGNVTAKGTITVLERPAE